MTNRMEWNEIREYLSNVLNIPAYILDYVSVQNALKYCVSGYSVSSISRRLEYYEEDTVSILEQYLDFSGFEEDVDFNPYLLFKRCSSLEEFIESVHNTSAITLDETIKVCYNICMKYEQIRKEIVNAYYETD